MSSTIENADPNNLPSVYSVFGGDPELSELVEMFVDEIPDRISTLETSFASGEISELIRAAHQLKGAAGSYGFDDLTPVAAKLEQTAREAEPEESIRESLEELVSFCRRLRAGEPS